MSACWSLKCICKVVTPRTTTLLDRASTPDAVELAGINGGFGARYRTVRSVTTSLAAGASAEDQMVQSCPEASPMKWHQAHTTWFFETFVLRPFAPNYKPFREEFRWLFNSYYNSLGEQAPEKQMRGSFSRPSLDEVLAFRIYTERWRSYSQVTCLRTQCNASCWACITSNSIRN